MLKHDSSIMFQLAHGMEREALVRHREDQVPGAKGFLQPWNNWRCSLLTGDGGIIAALAKEQ